MNLIYFRAEDLGFDGDGSQIAPQLNSVSIEQSIMMHPDIAGLPAWTAVVNDATLALVEGDDDFAGIGVNGVIAKYPQVAKYLKYVTYDYQGESFVLTEDKNIPGGATNVLTGFARHTFAGYDPMTGVS